MMVMGDDDIDGDDMLECDRSWIRPSCRAHAKPSNAASAVDSCHALSAVVDDDEDGDVDGG